MGYTLKIFLYNHFECDKLKNMDLKIESFNDYKSKKFKYNLTLEPKIKYVSIWKNWYDFLGVDISDFPKNYIEWKKKCIKLNITNEREYHDLCDMHNLPWMISDMYNEHTAFDFVKLSKNNNDNRKIKVTY